MFEGTRWQVHVALVALVAAVAALIAASTASAATLRVAITGSVQTTAVVGGDPSIGIGTASTATSTYTGIGTSTGTIMQTPSAPIDPSATGPGASLTVFHGDVSQGCVRVNGNRTLVVGLLPVNEQFDTSFGHIDGLGGLFEDNGVATAGPVDRAAAITYRTSSRVNACDPTKPFPTSSPGALNSGDTSFGYTDRLDGFPAKSDSDASVVNPNGLSVSITDEPDPKGLRATVSAGSGFATLDSSGQQVNVSAGGSVRLTCASLIVEVVTGSAVVPLDNGTTVVSVPEGGAVEIAESTDGGSTIKIWQVPVEVTVDGVSGSISAGETVDYWFSRASSAQSTTQPS